MKKNAKPDQEAFEELVQRIERADNIPKGFYSIFLNDNNIDKESGIGQKDNTLKRAHPDYIVKE